MKKVIASIAILVGLLPILASAQTETKGTIVTANNEIIEGTIKDQLQRKGNILFVNANGTKKLYTPSDISGFTINGVKYISYASDFYKEVGTGNKATLYQRVTDNSGKMLYNGAEVVSISTAEGKFGDYYLQIKSDLKFNLLTKKNFAEVMSSLCADCATVQANIKSGQLNYTEVAKAVEQYNNCL